MNTQLTTTDYSNIAKMILTNVPNESKAFEVEVDYDVEYREVIGGSYDGWDFERLREISYERLDVVGVEAYDNEGDTVNIEISTSTIEKLLN